MSDTPTSLPDILEVIDSALTAALREVRRARARGPVAAGSQARPRDRTSNINQCLDVLTDAGHPLHVATLLDALTQLGITTSRDALASALSKKLAPHGPFIRTAPNTFGLAARDRR
jgi:hypothetical protein